MSPISRARSFSASSARLSFEPEPVIQFAREFTDLLDQAREVDERRPVALLESRDPGVDPGLGFLQVHLSERTQLEPKRLSS